MADVTLTAAIRSNLLNLQGTSRLLERTQDRLSTGKKVNTAVDNPTNFFAAAGLNDRATALEGRLDSMSAAIQTVKAADSGITAIRSLLSQMKGIANDALGNTDSTARGDLGKQFNEVMRQVDMIGRDSRYQGINLLREEATGTAQQFDVQFNEKIDVSTLVITGFQVGTTLGSEAVTELNASGEFAAGATWASATGFAGGSNYSLVVRVGGTMGSNSASDTGVTFFGIQSADVNATALSTVTGGWQRAWAAESGYKDEINTVIGQIEDMDTGLQSQAKSLANNLSVVSIREDFTNRMVNTLKEGADKLTLADLNEEGANLLALQTSQSLGVNALSLASQSTQSVLQLVG
jgi:flagellin-like hook-associated protein FlgL